MNYAYTRSVRYTEVLETIQLQDIVLRDICYKKGTTVCARHKILQHVQY